MDSENQKQKFIEFLPIFSYLVVYFLLQSFDWMEATKIILGIVASLLTFFVMSSLTKEDHELSGEQIRRLNFQIGLLSLLFLLLFASGFLAWYRMVSNLWRNGILFSLLLIYLVVLFRSMRILAEVKENSKLKKKS